MRGRKLRRFAVVLAAGAAIFIGVVPVTRGQEESNYIPEADVLGAASHMAYYGLLAIELAAGPSSSDTGTGKPPRIGVNTRVNAPQVGLPGGLLGRSETTIAASKNGNNLVAGWNDAEGFCGTPFGAPCPTPAVKGLSGFAYSLDDGTTWTDGGAPFNASGVMTRGDPSLDVGGAGNDTFYYANLAASATTGAGAGMIVHRGTFKAQTFSWDTATIIPPPFAGAFLDKELLATDKNGSRPHVYISVTNFFAGVGTRGQIEAYSSTDGGTTYARSIVHPAEFPVLDQGSAPAVGPNGEVYVAWERGWQAPAGGQGIFPQIRLKTSLDNGATWSPPGGVLVADICAGALFPPFAYNRGVINDFPRIAVAQSGPQKGRVYVTWGDCRIANGGTQAATGGVGNRNTDIYVAHSDDQGATWSAPVLVAGGATKQFWPVVTVQPGGNVDVTYYDAVQVPASPPTPSTSLVDTYWAQSLDGGVTWETPEKVTTATSNWRTTATNIAPNFGDYNTHVSAGDRLFVTWADGRAGVPDTFFAKILTIGKAPR